MPDIEINNFDSTKFRNTLTNTPVLGKIKLGVGRRRIFDAANRVIGTCAGNKIYDLNGKLWGTIITKDSDAGFNKNEIVDRGTVIATIDSRKNIYRKMLSAFKADTSTNVYLGTIKSNKVVSVLLPLLISILAVTAVSGVILSGILKGNNEPDYLKEAPVLSVYSNSVFPSNSWKQKSEIDIFNKGSQKMAMISPGSNGTYTFAIRNENTHAIEYSIRIRKNDDHDYNLLYRLALIRAGGRRYVAGNDTDNGYLEPEAIVPSKVTLEPGAVHYYDLDWIWRLEDTEEQNEIDTNIGKNYDKYTYKVEITISAEYVG